MTEFRVLGGVEIDIDGQRIDAGHARQRCVLAALLVDVRRPISTEMLLDRVWSDRPPQRARNALSGYLSRLRQLLSAADDVRIERRSGGYLLAADPMSVDLHRFRHLLGQAGAAGDPGRAEELLRQALDLWRGEPFSGLDSPWLDGVRAALHARWWAARLDRHDLVLDRGGQAELVADLEVFATAYPYDERLAGQLMLAQYRCGRQADALRAYHDIRARLADEQGTDPGPPLRKLYQRILNADPDLIQVPPASSRPGPATGRTAEQPVPRQLPLRPLPFVGRTRELAELDRTLAGREPATAAITVISGTAGVGKTALALHWAHRAADRFPDGQLYVNLRGFGAAGSGTDPGEAVRGFLDALAVPPPRIPPTVDAQVARYRSLVAGKRMLVMLDNARDAEQVRPLLPGTPSCAVLVTSRHQLAGLVATEGAGLLRLDLLTDAEAGDLLAGRLGTGRVRAEPQAVAKIVSRCARLPLALVITAARAAANADFALELLAKELDAQHRLDALDGGDQGADVRAVFSWSYQALHPAPARLFRLLGLHPGPDISAAAAASLAGAAPARVRAELAELVRAHLVVESVPGRYTMHDLLRAYAAELADALDEDAERRAARGRMLDHYLTTAYRGDQLLYQHRDLITPVPAGDGVSPEELADRDQAMTWYTAEHPVLLGAVAHAADRGFGVHAWQLAWAMWHYLNLSGHLHDQITVQRAALAGATAAGDPIGRAHAHRGLGRTSYLLDRADEADRHLHRALELFDQLGDQPGQAQVHINLAELLRRQGRAAEALDHDRRALDLYRAAGHRAGQARVLNNLGWAHTQLGEHRAAIDYCRESLALHQDTGNRHGEATALDSLGYAHTQLGQHPEAIDCYERALALFQETGDRYFQADTLVHLGEARDAVGDRDAARSAWRQAVEILTEIAHPEAEQVRARLRELP